MLIQRLTMRASLTLTIVVMGLFGLGLALVTGEMYRQEALENQRTAMVSMLRLKTSDLLNDLESKSRDLGLLIQHGDKFQRAFNARDAGALARLMDSQFHQYFATADVIKLQKLQVFDHEFSQVAESSEGTAKLANGNVACPALMAQVRARQGRFRLLPASQLCVFADQVYYAVIVPVGGLRPRGYLQVTTDPSYSLAQIESALGMPLRMTIPPGSVIYQSKAWMSSNAMEKALVAEYPLETPVAGRVMTVAILSDIQALHEKLATTRNMVMMAAGVITLLMIAVALLVLQNTTLRPLLALHDKLRTVLRDRARLGETLAPGGTVEIRELSRDFNALSTELGGLHRMLRRMAYTDTLTELPNRAHFHESLKQLTGSTLKNRKPLGLFVMDLDRFKEVNDTFGHDIGDQLLKQVGTRLKGVLRRSDNNSVSAGEENTTPKAGVIIARLGGDEFAVILPDVNEANLAVNISQKFIKAMEQPFMVGMHRFHVGVSIGIALYPEHGSDPMTLLRQADIAMYQAKKTKVGYAFFDSVRDHHKLLQLTFERDLRQAIEKDSLELYYQPMIDIRTGKVSCVEALIRWRYPAQDLTPPEKFIYIAEQCGLIQPLTRWVLNRAVENCSYWRKKGFPIDVSVNLSVMNLHEPDFVDYVMDTLHRWEVAPARLSLELTEGAVMSDPKHALEVLSRLDTMGVRISIDDFGTGYSSLAYLKRLPVDEIKIDKSFVKDMKLDSNDAVIVRSTIDLAHNMSLQVVAEGVENPETLRLLISLGCDKVQGYFFSQPLPHNQLMEWLDTSSWSKKQGASPAASGKKESSVVTLHRPRPEPFR